MRVRQRLQLVLTCLFAISGCTDPGEIGASMGSATVFGQVFTAAGAPVQGATVITNAHRNLNDCRSGTSGVLNSGRTTTDSIGRYRARMISPFIETFCISVRVNLSTGGVVVAGADSVRFRLESPNPDSLRVDVRFP
jgi:hypothetical protein